MRNLRDAPRITKSILTAALKAVNHYHLTAQALGAADGVAASEELVKELETFFSAFGANVPERDDVIARGLSKKTREQLRQLANADEVAFVLQLYRELFGPSTEIDIPIDLIDDQLGATTSEDLPTATDMGVEQESRFSEDMLFQFFDVRSGNKQFPGFNRWYHKYGRDPWLDEASFQNLKEGLPNPDWSPLMPTWAQMVAIKAILRLSLSPAPDPGQGAVLLADEVGLGKTLQVIGTVAFLNHLALCDEENRNRPADLVKYVGGHVPQSGEPHLPDLPSIVVAPGTLISQWAEEIRRMTLPKSYDILIYRTGKKSREEFWRKNDGLWDRSAHRPRRKIILVAHATMAAEARTYLKVASSITDPCEGPGIADGNSMSLFKLDYLVMAVDEIHMLRNRNAIYWGVLALSKHSKIRLGCTATPLNTSPKDLASIGRLIGVAGMMSPDVEKELRGLDSELRRARRKLTAEEKSLSAEHMRMRLAGDDPDPASDPLIGIRQLQLQMVGKLQARFGGRIIRRNDRSVDWQGIPVKDVPEYVEYSCLLKLQQEEIAAIEGARLQAQTRLGGRHFAERLQGLTAWLI
ncbi:DNA repair protein rad5 [Grifola frondosa]|uniref:DNA repair protein rad5 n=1 Tax=Grifola frondosa TaxID=5627 RepID=A0A1C7MLH6_GRIFR|nr:DNA repair protein rad5 [Grifola frondosa]